MEMDDSGAGIHPLTTLFLFFLSYLPSRHPQPSRPRAALLQIHPYLIRVTIFSPRPSLNLSNLCVFISVSCSSSPEEERNNRAPARKGRR